MEQQTHEQGNLRKRTLQGGIILLAGFGIICAIFLYVYNTEEKHTPTIPLSITITSLFFTLLYLILAFLIYVTTTFKGEHTEGVNGIRLILYLAFFMATVVTYVGGFITRMTHKDKLPMALAVSTVCEASITCNLIASAASFKREHTRNEALYTLACIYFLLYNALDTYVAIHGLFEVEFTFAALQIVLKGLHIGFRTQTVAVIVSQLTSALGSQSNGGISSHGGVICKHLHPQQLYCSTAGALIGMLVGLLYAVYSVNKGQGFGIVGVGSVVAIFLAIVIPWRLQRDAGISFDWEHLLVFGCFYAGKMVGCIMQIVGQEFNVRSASIVLNAFENSIQVVVIVFLMSSKTLKIVPIPATQAVHFGAIRNFLQNAIVWIGIGYFILLNAAYTIDVVLKEYQEPTAGRVLQSLVSACIFDFRLHACLMWCWIWRVIHSTDCTCGEGEQDHRRDGPDNHRDGLENGPDNRRDEPDNHRDGSENRYDREIQQSPGSPSREPLIHRGG